MGETGRVSASVRVPPPTVGAPSNTSTPTPARARVIAAAKPLGPAPTTRHRRAPWTDVTGGPVGRRGKASGLTGELGLGFDLDQPARVEQGGDHHHGGGRPDGAEELAVHRADGVRMLDRGDEHARPHHVGPRGAGFAEGLLDDVETAASLGAGVGRAFPIGEDGSGTRDQDPVPDPYGPAETDGGLEGRPRTDQLASDHASDPDTLRAGGAPGLPSPGWPGTAGRPRPNRIVRGHGAAASQESARAGAALAFVALALAFAGCGSSAPSASSSAATHHTKSTGPRPRRL